MGLFLTVGVYVKVRVIIRMKFQDFLTWSFETTKNNYSFVPNCKGWLNKMHQGESYQVFKIF